MSTNTELLREAIARLKREYRLYGAADGGQALRVLKGVLEEAEADQRPSRKEAEAEPSMTYNRDRSIAYLTEKVRTSRGHRRADYAAKLAKLQGGN